MENDEWLDSLSKEMSNIYIPKVGDTFYLPKHRYRVRIKSIICDENLTPSKKTVSHYEWGIINYMDYDCDIDIETNQSGEWKSENRSVKLGWIQVLINQKYWIQEKNINEQEEDFSWLDVSNVPDQNSSYIDRVKYALKNTEFSVTEDLAYTSIEIKEGSLLTYPTRHFIRSSVLDGINDVIGIDYHKNEWYYPIYQRLYDILIQFE